MYKLAWVDGGRDAEEAIVGSARGGSLSTNIIISWESGNASYHLFIHFLNLFFILFFNFTILYWFCHISTWIRHRYTCVPHSEPSSLPILLEKAEEPEIKLPTSAGSSKKQESSRKTSIFCFIDYAKAFDCVDHNKLWKILKEMGIPDHLNCLLRNLMQVRKQQLELDMEQQTGSK